MQIQNKILTTTDTEYSVTLPTGAKSFSIQCRTAVALRLALSAGLVAGSTAPYWDIPASTVFNSPANIDLRSGSLVLYFAATSGASPVVEVISY